MWTGRSPVGQRLVRSPLMNGNARRLALLLAVAPLSQVVEGPRPVGRPFESAAPAVIGAAVPSDRGGVDARAVSFAVESSAEQLVSSDVIEFEPFDECLVSWNARHAKSTGFGVEISVARAKDGPFSPWHWIGEWNVSERPAELAPSFEDAQIDVDTFRSETPWRALRWRVRVRSAGSEPLGFALDRLTL